MTVTVALSLTSYWLPNGSTPVTLTVLVSSVSGGAGIPTVLVQV